MKVQILDKIWVMHNNVPKELTITKVVTTETLGENDSVVVEFKAFAIYSETLKDEMVVNLENAYPSKDELMRAVFNFNIK